MTGVALRCPVCGTTQGEPGECDACSEGEVRYFCGNHDPGLWLDGPTCTQCGARFGEKPPPRQPPPSRATRPTRVSTERTRPPVLGRRERGGGSGRPAEPDEGPAVPTLSDLLADIAEAHGRSRDERDEEPRRVPDRETFEAAPRTSFPVVGCLFRLVMLVLFLVALAALGLLLLFGGAMEGF